MTDRYENIRKALAMGPTPGTRRVIDGDSHPYVTVALPENEGCRWKDPIICKLYEDVTPDDHIGCGALILQALPNASANAAYIAACDPDTIRALLEERDALREVLQVLVNWTPSADTYRRLGFDPEAPMRAHEAAKALLAKADNPADFTDEQRRL